MGEYLYFAIATFCNGKEYVIKFPDIDGCIVKANNIEDGINKAKQEVEIYLFNILKEGGNIPVATEAKDIDLKEGEFLILIQAYGIIANTLIKKNDEKINSKYKSSVMLLDHVTKEYDKEDTRSARIDSRIPIFMTIATFLGGFIFNIGGGESLKKTYELGEKIYSLYIIVYVACISTIILSIGVFAWILCTKKYTRIDTNICLYEKANKEENGKIAYELMQGYQEALLDNIKVNDKKMQQYNIAIGLLGAGGVLYIILKCISFFIN